ncbi:MAG TPA: EamA family transporter [Spirochaetota bacterium]|nr:EamA family transporter [Spirochaetota bacterium]HOS40878.1 EamA family transporter [Spirochaetota bacterium]HPU88818.1 EamA family transporter [Spirochaetota bacterium]
MSNAVAYLSLVGTTACAVCGQMIIKWRINAIPHFPAALPERLWFIVRLLFDPYIIAGFAVGLVGLVLWLNALSKLHLSYAYPFMGMNFVLIFVMSALVFGEPVTIHKIIGAALIVAGLIVSSQSI